jgi:hypothetical protein
MILTLDLEFDFGRLFLSGCCWTSDKSFFFHYGLCLVYDREEEMQIIFDMEGGLRIVIYLLQLLFSCLRCSKKFILLPLFTAWIC